VGEGGRRPGEGGIFNFFTASGRGNVEVANREVTWDKTLFHQREKPLVAFKARLEFFNRKISIMSASDILFLIVAVVTVGSAAIVVLSRSLIYSAFSLLFTFFGVAIIYVYLGADFLAATQVLIYVGGILVLLLFGVMLTHRLYSLNLKTETFQVIPGFLIAFAVFISLALVSTRTKWHVVADKPLAPTTDMIGTLFLIEYLLPFEIASILLLVALIGAAMLVRRRTDV